MFGKAVIFVASLSIVNLGQVGWGQSQAPTSHLMMTPTQTVTFVGDFPCTDCSGSRFTLTLFPKGIFRSRLTRRAAASGKDESVFDLGRWVIAKNGTQL